VYEQSFTVFSTDTNYLKYSNTFAALLHKAIFTVRHSFTLLFSINDTIDLEGPEVPEVTYFDNALCVSCTKNKFDDREYFPVTCCSICSTCCG
jgi:hypothetical protein